MLDITKSFAEFQKRNGLNENLFRVYQVSPDKIVSYFHEIYGHDYSHELRTYLSALGIACESLHVISDARIAGSSTVVFQRNKPSGLFVAAGGFSPVFYNHSALEDLSADANKNFIPEYEKDRPIQEIELLENEIPSLVLENDVIFQVLPFLAKSLEE